MTSLKTILLGTVLVIAVLSGSFSALVSSYSTYNISASQASIYNDSIYLLREEFNANVSSMQDQLQEDGSFTLGVASSLGFVWNSATTFLRLIFDSPRVITTVINDVAGNPLFPVPSWALSALIGGLTVVIIIIIGAILFGRSSDDT